MGTETDMLNSRDQAGLEKKNVGLSLALCLAVSLGLSPGLGLGSLMSFNVADCRFRAVGRLCRLVSASERTLD